MIKAMVRLVDALAAVGKRLRSPTQREQSDDITAHPITVHPMKDGIRKVDGVRWRDD